MTSISGSMSAAAMMSPNDRMKLMLQSAVSAGTVKSADQTALSGALDDIDTAMKSSGPPAAGTDPSSMKTKIDSLVDQEVSDGKLTSDQATELKQVFASAAQGMRGAHGHHGPPPPSDDGDDATATAASTSTGATGTTTSSDTAKQAIETLIAFLKQLEQTTSATSNYTASGGGGGSTVSSVLVDGTA